MKIENITACVFDAYGTLFDVNSAAAKCKKKLGDRWENFANAWRTTQLEYTWLRSLMKKHKNFWEITEDSLDHTMETFKIKKEMKNNIIFGVQDVKKGRIVYLADNPLFRAFWYNGKLLFGNAVFIVGG